MLGLHTKLEYAVFALNRYTAISAQISASLPDESTSRQPRVVFLASVLQLREAKKNIELPIFWETRFPLPIFAKP